MKGSAEKVLRDSNEGPNITKAITCVSCASEIPSDDIENGVAPLVNLEVLLGIPGMPAMEAMRFCGQTCKDRYKGSEKRNRSTQQKKIASILDSNAVTKILKTKLRVGVSVNVFDDLSCHRHVYGGVGKVVEMNYNSAIDSAELKVKCISGVYRILPSGCSLIDDQNRPQSTRNTNDTGVFLKPGSKSTTLKMTMEQRNKRILEGLKISVTSSSEQQLHAATDAMKASFEQRVADEMEKNLSLESEAKKVEIESLQSSLASVSEAKKVEIESLQSSLASVLDREEKSQNELMSELQNIKHELTELKSQHNRSRRQNTLLRKELTESENERQRLESENERLRLESEVSQGQSIKSLWLPGVNEEQRGQPFDNRTRLLIMELLSYNVPPGSVNRAIAALLDNVFFEPEHQVHLKRTLVLPSRKFAQDIRLELGFINRATMGIALADCEQVNTWGSDASPYYGTEILSTALQLEKKNADGTNSYEDWVLGYSILPDQKSATEARIIKENVFDRMEDAVRKVNGAIEETQSLDGFMKSMTRKLASGLKPIYGLDLNLDLDLNSPGIEVGTNPIGLDLNSRGIEVDTNRIGVYRLGNAVGQSDNAPAALKVKDEMAILIANDAVKKYGEEAWNVSSILSIHFSNVYLNVLSVWLLFTGIFRRKKSKTYPRIQG